jgi:arylsulfatase A-like enzyme
MKLVGLSALVATLCCQALYSAHAETVEPCAPTPPPVVSSSKPNILLILTDDQGFSDLGFYGNPSLETPHLDALARESVRLEDFLASPTCSPTRAALMTGKHEFKVGITHTISGRSLLKPNVPTLPAHFKSAGYRTAIFGKWHLGETFPSRPQDRGFDEVFIHLGGGIGQTPDYWGNTYFDPYIQHNGHWIATQGYCTAVFSQTAWDWIDNGSASPWLAYLSLNTPHTPLQVDDKLAQKYLDKGLPNSQARFYAMIDDLDREVGELLQKLDDTGRADNTIVLFMGDNGSAKGGRPDEMEYNAGLRGTKASAYQGGVRVPCLIRWPAGNIQGGRAIDTLASMIDIFPTLADLAGMPLDARSRIDGRSLVPLLDSTMDAQWADRTVVTHVGRWANGQAEAHKYKGSSIRNERFTLIEGETLYDLQNDQGEQTDVTSQYPEVFDTLRAQYEQWWHVVCPLAEDVPPLTVGAPEAPISHLTCMDWGASNLEATGDHYPPWNQSYVQKIARGEIPEQITPFGAWTVHFARSGTYRITLRTLPEEAPLAQARLKAGTATLFLDGKSLSKPIPAGARSIQFNIDITQGTTTLETLIESADRSIPAHGAFYVSIELLNTP